MQDDLAAANRDIYPLEAVDVALDELDLVRDGKQVLAPPGRKVVKDAYLMPLPDESVDEVRSDESGAACYENPQCASFRKGRASLARVRIAIA